MQLHSGMRVKVVKVPDEPDFADVLGKRGVVDGAPWDEDGGQRCYVILDGEKVGTEFLAEELAPDNAKVIEGEVSAFGDDYYLNDGGVSECITQILDERIGKRVRIAIEEV